MRWRVVGELRPPGDKSISHRTLILAAVARGTSRVTGLLDAADTQATADALRRLGCEIPLLGQDITVHGSGRRGLTAPTSDLDCRNSGTTARLLAGVVAGARISARFTGDGSLSRRPMRRIAEPLTAMGATVELERGDGLPMRIAGGELRSIRWRIEPPSAQVKGAILLAAAVGEVDAEIDESAPTRDHTERMLRAAGATVEWGGAGHGAPTTSRVRVEAPADLEGREWVVPGDPSSAAYLCALALLADEGEVVVNDVCVNPTRTGFVGILQRMGAALEIVDREDTGVEPIGRLRASGCSLRGVEIGREDVAAAIDEIPLIACLAARAGGITTIRGAGELRLKESDRIAAIVGNLRRVGASAEETADGLVVEGSDRSLRGLVHTRGDHRIAMAFGILAADPRNEITIDDRDCVGISYPRFWTDIDRLTNR